MLLLFLQNKLPDYRVSHVKSLPFLIKELDEPCFCILPKFPSLKKTKELALLQDLYPFIIWIAPEMRFVPFFFKKNQILTLQPLYFVRRTTKDSFMFYDERYLKIKNTLYKLPPLAIDISTFSLKSEALQDKEDFFFHPFRKNLYYLKGDTTDRLFQPPYVKALRARQNTALKKTFSSIYIYLMKILDKKYYIIYLL